MHYAIVLSLCLTAASPVSPSREVEVEAAARAFRIESYNQCREDRERYQQLRDADDDLRVGLAATKERELAARQEEALAWYREATAAVHAKGDVPASPVWLAEALADAAAGKLREKSASPIAARKNSSKSSFSSNAVPPQLSPANSGDRTDGSADSTPPTPFFFVNAALKAIGGVEPTNSKVDEVEVKEPVIHPAGPIVNGRVEEPETAPVKGSARKAAEKPAEPLVEPTLELPTLGSNADEQPAIETPAIELPELSSN